MRRASYKKGNSGGRPGPDCRTLERRKKEEKAWPWWYPWLIAAIAVVCYVNSLGCGLVFDDKPAIQNNMDLRPTTPIFSLLYNDFWGTPMQKEESHKSYRPLCVFTFRINFWLHQLHPVGYHFFNIILHAFVCIQYFRLCCRFVPQKCGLMASILFAVHPVHTEAVTGVVGRAELLSSVFFVEALLTYFRLSHGTEVNGCTFPLRSLLLAGLAMVCKEQGITVVAVCVVYDIFLVQQVSRAPLIPDRAPRGKVKGPTPTWRKDLVLRLLVMSVGTVLLLAVRLRIMGSKLPVFNKFDNPAASEGWPVRHLTHSYITALNVWLLLYPSSLLCDWTMGTVSLVKSPWDARVAGTLFFYSMICLLVWKSGATRSEHSRRIFMGVCLCVFPFLPASNLFYPVGFVVAERILYIPSMGFCLLVSVGWNALYHACSSRKKRAFLHVCFVVLLCLNTLKTIRRNFDWQSEESLFLSGLKVTQTNAKLYNNLGHVMEAEGRHSDALKLFLQAVQVQPDDLGSHLNVGRAYNHLGMADEAEKAFWMAKDLLPKAELGGGYQTHIAPRHMDLFLNLGSLLSRNESRLEEAQQLYREAISMKTDYVDAYMHRASVLQKLNRSDEAKAMYKEALKYDQANPDIFYNMGVLFLEQGNSVQALTLFDRALQLDPRHEKSLLNYAILSQDSGDSNLRRIAHERLHLLLDKGHQPERTYFNLGVLAMQDGDAHRAEQYFRKTLELKADYEGALFNLAFTLYEQGRPLDAVPYLQRLGNHHTKGLLLLGNIYFNFLQNYTAAQQCYEAILQKDPNNILAINNVCAALSQMGLAQGVRYCPQHGKQYSQHQRQKINHTNTQQRQKNNVAYCSLVGSNCDVHYASTDDGKWGKEPSYSTGGAEHIPL